MRLVYKGNYIRMTCGEIGLVQDVYFSLHTVGIPPELFQIKSDVSSLYYIPQAQNIKKHRNIGTDYDPRDCSVRQNLEISNSRLFEILGNSKQISDTMYSDNRAYL